jgi:hypothetical protein
MMPAGAFALRAFLATAALMLPAGLRAQTDAIDLRQAVVHDSPADVADWPVTVRISRLTMRPGGLQPDGLAFETAAAIPDAWNYHVPGWGDPGRTCPADGCVLYTVWAVAKVRAHWHAAGFIQMWKGRPSTGAPILSDFHKNWAYAHDRWGDLNEYIPHEGDWMGFFLTAGNARHVGGATSVRERSNVVMVRLPAGDSGAIDFGGRIRRQPPASPVSR